MTPEEEAILVSEEKVAMPEWPFYDEGEIAAALGRTKATVNRRARRGRKARGEQAAEAPWPVHHFESRQGGATKLYHYPDLPQDVRWALDRYADGGPLPRPAPARYRGVPWEVARAALAFLLGFIAGMAGGAVYLFLTQ